MVVVPPPSISMSFPLKVIVPSESIIRELAPTLTSNLLPAIILLLNPICSDELRTTVSFLIPPTVVWYAPPMVNALARAMVSILLFETVSEKFPFIFTL